MKSQQLFKKYPIAISAGAAFIIFAALAIFRSGSAGDLRAELSSREVDASRLSENLHNAQRLPAQLDEMDSLWNEAKKAEVKILAKISPREVE